MKDKRNSAKVAHRLAIVRVLLQVLMKIGILEPGGERQPSRRVKLILGVRLNRIGYEPFVKIGQKRVYPGARVGRGLEAVGGRPLIPRTQTEDSTSGNLGHE